MVAPGMHSPLRKIWPRLQRFCCTLPALAIACTLSCARAKNLSGSAQGQTLSTWASRGESEPRVPQIRAEETLAEGAFPVAGTVSHHLLAGFYIDQWFKALASARQVDTFFIISPSHYGLSTQEWSLYECTWNAGEYGLVQTDAKAERELAKALGVSYDKNAYRIEHGLSTLMPYIAKYFPNAKVCTVAVNGEPPLKQAQAQKLTEALAPHFAGKKAKKNFLLVSTDFSHHGDDEQTKKKDGYSRMFFKNPTAENWFYCVCDNRQGMYALTHLFCKKNSEHGGQRECTVLYHTNSFELSGQGKDDITSYFFSFVH